MQAEVLGSVVSKATVATAEVFRVGPFDDPDRYEIGEPVEAGAEGILYRGQLVTPTSRLSLPVAVKALQPVYSERIDQWAARWRDQVELLRSLHIPGLVGVREGFVGPLPHLQGAETAGRNLYLVMNWVEGEALDHWVLQHRDIDISNALKLLLPVAVALDTMHGGQLTGGVAVVHRDIKPANILIGKTGSVLVDFGLTKGLASGHPVGRAGTPGYIAPEVVGGGAYTPAADRYAFGATVFFLITGRHPSAGIKPAQLRHLLEASPTGGTGGTPSELVDRVVTMLDPDPERRPIALANWIAQLRQSSLDDEALSVRLAPPAPTRSRRGVVLSPVAAAAGGTGPSREPAAPALNRSGAHRAPRAPMHSRRRSRLTRPYALVVVLAVALITVASDAGAITGSRGKRSGLVAVLGGGTSTQPATRSDQPALTGIAPGSQAVVTPVGGDPNAAPAPARPGVPVVSVAPAPSAKPCFKSFDPACPPARWDPQPKNQPLTVSFRFDPQHPLPGQLVRFTVVLDDPDTSQNLLIDGAYFGDDPAAATPGALGAANAQGTNRAPGCPTPRGFWPPPAPGPHGHTTKQLTYTYQAPGAYQVHFLASSGQTYDPCRLSDPYASKASSITQTVTIDQPPPPPTTTTPPTDPPPDTTTTTPGTGTF
jgi:serine/threonine protein kinase